MNKLFYPVYFIMKRETDSIFERISLLLLNYRLRCNMRIRRASIFTRISTSFPHSLMKYAGYLLPILTFSLHAHAAELAAKYDFESDAKWLPDWGAALGSKYLPATGWKTPFKVTLEKGESHSGDACLKMEILEPATGEKILHTNAFAVPAPTEGKKTHITVRFYIRTQGLSEKSLHLRGLEKDESGRTLKMLGDAKSLVAISPSSEWTEVRWEGALNEKTRKLMIMFAITSSDAPATLWLDDLSVEADPDPAQ
jgi:hypothetical protein